MDKSLHVACLDPSLPDDAYIQVVSDLLGQRDGDADEPATLETISYVGNEFSGKLYITHSGEDSCRIEVLSLDPDCKSLYEGLVTDKEKAKFDTIEEDPLRL